MYPKLREDKTSDGDQKNGLGLINDTAYAVNVMPNVKYANGERVGAFM